MFRCKGSAKSRQIVPIDADPDTVGCPSPSTASMPATKKRRRSNADGMALTPSGRVSTASNPINIRYDASYRNSENETRLLGRLLTLGQACGTIGVCLYGANMPLEGSGTMLHILQCCILNHAHFHILNYFCMFFRTH